MTYIVFGIEVQMLVRTPRDVGALIRQARLDQKISQRELAEKIGVYQPKISEIERGKAGAGVGLVLQILSVLGLTIEVTTPDMPQMSLPVDTEPHTTDDLADLDAVANTGLEK